MAGQDIESFLISHSSHSLTDQPDFIADVAGRTGDVRQILQAIALGIVGEGEFKFTFVRVRVVGYIFFVILLGDRLSRDVVPGSIQNQFSDGNVAIAIAVEPNKIAAGVSP